jgi:hypothetical protein
MGRGRPTTAIKDPEAERGSSVGGSRILLKTAAHNPEGLLQTVVRWEYDLEQAYNTLSAKLYQQKGTFEFKVWSSNE